MSKNQPFRSFQATKKLNLVSPTLDPRLSGDQCRDKIESNLQSQMYVERTPCLEESRFSGINILGWKSDSSTVAGDFFREYLIAAADRETFASTPLLRARSGRRRFHRPFRPKKSRLSVATFHWVALVNRKRSRQVISFAPPTNRRI
jgi:hypothetical protein